MAEFEPEISKTCIIIPSSNSRCVEFLGEDFDLKLQRTPNTAARLWITYLRRRHLPRSKTEQYNYMGLISIHPTILSHLYSLFICTQLHDISMTGLLESIYVLINPSLQEQPTQSVLTSQIFLNSIIFYDRSKFQHRGSDFHNVFFSRASPQIFFKKSPSFKKGGRTGHDNRTGQWRIIMKHLSHSTEWSWKVFYNW